jgi:hypothetical protein
MSYTINKTNGEILLTVLDGSKDTVGGLTFIGKNYVSYGEIQNENFARLLENFANSSEPTDALKGQLWYDTTSGTNILKVYDGVRFRNVSAQTVASTAPSISNLIGDGWWDTTNDQYKVYNGSEWLLVGPAYSKLDGKTGAFSEVVFDTDGNKHLVVTIYSAGNRSTIISYDQEFTPNVAITGFSTIAPGVNLNTANPNNIINATSRNAQQLGNVAAVSYARKDINETFADTVTVNGDLNVGAATITSSAGNFSLANTTSDGTIKIQTNPGGTTVDSLTVDGATGMVILAAHPSAGYGAATKGYVDQVKATVDTELAANVLLMNTNIESNVGIINTHLTTLDGRMDTAEQGIIDLNIIASTKAPSYSPELTGVPLTPTAGLGDNSDQIASTAFVMNQDAEREYQTNLTIQANVDAINTDMTNRLALKADLESPEFTGAPTAPHPVFGANTAQIATTQYVQIATNYWGGSAKFVSTNYPDPSAGEIGDFWFRIES